MGSRNPDRFAWHEFAAQVETVGQMIDKGWRIRACCTFCGLQLEVNLLVTAALCGREFSLWDKHPYCRRVDCPGRVRFMAQAPRREPAWEPVERYDPKKYLGSWAGKVRY